jgi:Cd(II)/Pb(II)-responsive transcriptional regulator
MRISELAKRTNCDIETIRYYEKSGLLPEPARTSSGYREYQPEHQERLQFIRHCRSLQIGLPVIRALLDVKGNPSAGCQSVDELLDHQIGRVQAQMATLKTLEQQLISLRNQCREPHSVGECGILQNLNEAAESHACVCHDTEADLAQQGSQAGNSPNT